MYSVHYKEDLEAYIEQMSKLPDSLDNPRLLGLHQNATLGTAISSGENIITQLLKTRGIQTETTSSS